MTMDLAEQESIERTRAMVGESKMSMDAKMYASRLLDAAHNVVNGGSNDLSVTNKTLAVIIEDLVVEKIARAERLSSKQAVAELTPRMALLKEYKWPICVAVCVIGVCSPNLPAVLEAVSRFVN